MRRWRIPAAPLLDRDLLICPELVTPGILSRVERLLSGGPIVSVSHPLCPMAGGATPAELFPAFTDGRSPLIVLTECVGGYPELLFLELMGHLAGLVPGPVRSPTSGVLTSSLTT